MRKLFGSIAVAATAAAVATGTLLVPPAEPAVSAASARTSSAAPQQSKPSPRSAQAAVAGKAATQPSYTLVLGDSIAHRSRAHLKELRPRWIVDGVDGRNVDTLLPLLERWLDRKGRQPGALVVELGTNWSFAWDGADYAAVRDLVPDAPIIFVTPFRSPEARHTRSTGEYAHQRTGEYAAAMRRLADQHGGVCVAEWRTLVEKRAALLEDGVHPTAEGEQVWADLVASAMRECDPVHG